MKFFHYKRYLTLDPEAGNLTRYKTEQDCPLNPIETVPLENIISVGYAKREWFMKSDHEYLIVIYFSKQGLLQKVWSRNTCFLFQEQNYHLKLEAITRGLHSILP